MIQTVLTERSFKLKSNCIPFTPCTWCNTRFIKDVLTTPLRLLAAFVPAYRLHLTAEGTSRR